MYWLALPLPRPLGPPALANLQLLRDCPVTNVVIPLASWSFNMAARVLLITGCSSGIGLSTAVLLAKDPDKRFKVYATMRNLAKKDKLEAAAGAALGDTLFIKQLDVCSDDSVARAVEQIFDEEKRIAVLGRFPSYWIWALASVLESMITLRFHDSGNPKLGCLSAVLCARIVITV